MGSELWKKRRRDAGGLDLELASETSATRSLPTQRRLSTSSEERPAVDDEAAKDEVKQGRREKEGSEGRREVDEHGRKRRFDILKGP